MALSRHIDIDEVIAKAQDHSVHKHLAGYLDSVDVPYASRYGIELNIPRYKMPKEGVVGKVAYQLLHDELALDGNPNMNLASFVHTWVPTECKDLMVENLNKNLVDQDEYPMCQEVHERCVSMISNLWHAPPGADHKAIGTATTGSSEAIMLGGLALKRRWQERMKAAGKDIHNPGPNIIMGAEAQVALEKFARYFEVECRLIPVTKESHYVMDPKEAMKQVDENTIGIFVILGSTYTGAFEHVKEMADLLDKYEEKTGNHVPIHVDAASGGFVAPFVYPDLLWDFRIPRVQSINASGHKYGMSSVGVGWIIWRSAEFLPKEIIFELHYLGETDYSYNLNFSRPAHPIIGQMFNFLNLGFNGYKRVMEANLSKARTISRALEDSGYFTILSQVHIPAKEHSGDGDDRDPNHYIPGLPVVSFRFTDEVKKSYPGLNQFWVQHVLRQKSWIVPNYALPPACEKTEILRVVVRESLSGDLARKLIVDIIASAEEILNGEGPSAAMAKMATEGNGPKSKKRKTNDGSADEGKGKGRVDAYRKQHKRGDLDYKYIEEHTKSNARPC